MVHRESDDSRANKKPDICQDKLKASSGSIKALQKIADFVEQFYTLSLMRNDDEHNHPKPTCFASPMLP